MNEDKINSFLSHHGVKGMKWGVRKAAGLSGRQKSAVLEGKINSDGSITIPKGGELSRVVSSSASFGSVRDRGVDYGGKVMYAAFTKRDRATYEEMFGRSKSIFNKEASEIVTFHVDKELKAPSLKETTTIFYKELAKDPAAQKAFIAPLLKKEKIDAVLKDPTNPETFWMYGNFFDKSIYSDKPELQRFSDNYLSAVKKAGYNMLLDPSDSAMGIANAPVVLLDAQNTVNVSSRRLVDKLSKQKLKPIMKEYNKQEVENFLEKMGYV